MRRELKFLVAERDRERLAARLAPFVRPDAHADRTTGGYTVRSIYFDTPGLRDYADKLSGDHARRKVRVRGYNAPGAAPVVLEVKRKRGAGSWKDRAPMPAAEAARLLAGGRPAPGAPDAVARFLYRLRAEHRRPTLLVTYDREPLVGRFDPSLRVTLDRRLRCAPYPRLGAALEGLYADGPAGGLAPVLDGRLVLEVKFDRAFPSWLTGVLAPLDAPRLALSKYGMGLDARIPQAPWRFGAAALPALAARPA